MKTKLFKLDPLELPEDKQLSNEEIGNAAMDWLRNANLGFHPSTRLQWIACVNWLRENNYLKS